MTEKKWKADALVLTYGDEDIVLEKEIFLSSNGEDVGILYEVSDFREMEKEYKDKNINLSLVMDAEGTSVCIAPEPIARLIAKLLTEYEAK